MDMFDSLFSQSCVLNEQIARQVFECFSSRDPVLVIMDRAGHYWPSDSVKFSKLKVDEHFLKELRCRINDGAEPVVTQVNGCAVIAAQLATERTNCGYVMIIIPDYGDGQGNVNIDLLEIVLDQIALIARLIEKNSLLYELQVKNLNLYGRAGSVRN